MTAPIVSDIGSGVQPDHADCDSVSREVDEDTVDRLWFCRIVPQLTAWPE